MSFFGFGKKKEKSPPPVKAPEPPKEPPKPDFKKTENDVKLQVDTLNTKL